MNEVLPQDAAHRRVRDWRKSASDHVAYALLVYTALQIFITVQAMKSATTDSLSIMPYLALVILVAAIIPACHWFEKRWAGISDEQAADLSYSEAFRSDIFRLWAIALGLPFFLTGLCKLTFALIG